MGNQEFSGLGARPAIIKYLNTQTVSKSGQEIYEALVQGGYTTKQENAFAAVLYALQQLEDKGMIRRVYKKARRLAKWRRINEWKKLKSAILTNIEVIEFIKSYLQSQREPKSSRAILYALKSNKIHIEVANQAQAMSTYLWRLRRSGVIQKVKIPGEYNKWIIAKNPESTNV
jgi:Fe2+ or Zn2+ uptake regulation protein